MQYYTRSQGIRGGEVQLFMTGRGRQRVMHRELGDIPGILKAQDVFVEEDGYLTIKNPSKPYRPAYLT